MSLYSNVTEEGLIILGEISKQQKDQRDLEVKKRNLKQTHDIKLADSFSPLTKELDVIDETPKKLGEVIEKSQPEIITPSY